MKYGKKSYKMFEKSMAQMKIDVQTGLIRAALQCLQVEKKCCGELVRCAIVGLLEWRSNEERIWARWVFVEVVHM